MSTVATEAPSLLPPLRLLTAPACEPPYDDERDDAPVVHLLSRPLVPLPATVPLPSSPGDGLVPEPVPAHVHEQIHEPVDEETADAHARRTATAALPSPHRFAHALVQRLLEVLAGVRPLAQLQRDLSWEAYEALERRYRWLTRTPGPRPTARSVRSIHVQARPEGIAEVCATVERGEHRAALALRIEGRDGAWRCTELVGV